MKERESNIELLRFLAGCAVVILHYNFLENSGAVAFSEGLNYYFLIFLEIICITAVNIFVMIFGYFNCENNRVNPQKAVYLLIQLIVFNLFIYFFDVFVWKDCVFSIKGIINSFIPCNYYVILYIVLFFVSPYLNYIVNNMERNSVRNMIFILFFFFSIWATIVDVLKEITGNLYPGLSSIGISGSDSGYTIVNFILIYLIGAFIRKSEWIRSRKISLLICIYMTCVVVIFIWRNIVPETAWEYCNPILIVESVCAFVLFINLKIKSQFINFIAPASFSCYLIHMSILRKLDFSILENISFWFLVGHLIVTVVLIYIISLIIHYVYKAIMRFISKNLGRYLARKD